MGLYAPVWSQSFETSSCGGGVGRAGKSRLTREVKFSAAEMREMRELNPKLAIKQDHISLFSVGRIAERSTETRATGQDGGKTETPDEEAFRGQTGS